MKKTHKLNIFKKGFNYSQDGPGNRLVYHLVGCNMRCPWCSNPEGMDKSYLGDELLSLTIKDVYNEIIECKRLFFDGGGVTFTGGEATLQLGALKELFVLLKAADIDITIETNGTNQKLPELFPYMRQIIIDFKHYDNTIHLLYTGVSNKNIKENIIKALNYSLQVLVRIPLINNINASLKDIDGFLSFFKTINVPNLAVEFLSYHEFGKEKWLKNNRNYEIKDGFISEAIYKEFTKQFLENNIQVIKT